MHIRTSLIIPVYNTGRCLYHCLESVLAQTADDFECICIDDGSTDGSAVILDEYAKRDHRFVVEHRPNAGVAAARNRGLELAKGEYIAFLDADDAIPSEFIHCGTRALDNDSSLDAWICQRRYVDEDFCRIERQPPPVPAAIIGRPLVPFLKSYNRFYLFCVWGRVLRREIIAAYNICFPPIQISEDAVFMILYFSHVRRVMVADSPFILHSERAGSLCRMKGSYKIKDGILAVKWLLHAGSSETGVALCAARKALGLVKNCFLAADGGETWRKLVLMSEFRSLGRTILRYAPLLYKPVGVVLLLSPVGLLIFLRRCKKSA